MWDWLTSPENRETITWLAGGLAAVVAGAWAVFKYFRSSRQRAGPSQTITADRGGVAAGRDAHVNRHQPGRRPKR